MPELKRTELPRPTGREVRRVQSSNNTKQDCGCARKENYRIRSRFLHSGTELTNASSIRKLPFPRWGTCLMHLCPHAQLSREKCSQESSKSLPLPLAQLCGPLCKLGFPCGGLTPDLLTSASSQTPKRLAQASRRRSMEASAATDDKVSTSSARLNLQGFTL